MDKLVLREIEIQSSLETELLLRMLGASRSTGASPATARDGKAILANARRTLRQRICVDERVKAECAAAGNPKVLLAAAIVDCIAGAVTGVSPITVAVLLVREGLDSLCKDIWANEH